MTGNQTRAERMRQPLASDVIAATAEQHGVCVRPFTMEVGDLDTGELRYVAVPCGSTIESQCGPCARKARGTADDPVPRGLAPHRGTRLHPGQADGGPHRTSRATRRSGQGLPASRGTGLG
jgi:hypothetical protein